MKKRLLFSITLCLVFIVLLTSLAACNKQDKTEAKFDEYLKQLDGDNFQFSEVIFDKDDMVINSNTIKMYQAIK